MVSGQDNVGNNVSTNAVSRKQTSTERRIQNRKAQKAYRDRKRQRLQELENKVHALESASVIQLPTSPSINNNLGTTPHQNIDVSINPLGDALNIDPLLSFPSANTGFTETSPWNDADMWLNPIELENNLDVDTRDDIAEEQPSSTTPTHAPLYPSTIAQNAHSPSAEQNAIQVYRPSGKMASFNPQVIRDCYTSLPQTTRNELRELAKRGDFTFIDVITLRLGSENNSSPVGPGRATLEDSAYCPYRNVLHIARFSYFAALFANFSSLGFDFSVFLDETSISPFVGRSNLDMALTDVPSSLRPLASQLSVHHHPYIDSLPFPEFRRRALAALSTDPPLLDEDDLCIDLMLNDGLVCWGSTNKSGMDRGTPWDSRSWEAKGWFLRKWWWLVGGQDGELWQSSRWWASQRGEQISMLECK
ncbi:hypothetical protein ACHAPT_001444 [Fusarium lateritium]